MSEKTYVTKAAGIVGAATFLSRIFGFLRDVVIGAFFGATLYSDAFFVAFRIPNLLRRLFAEGSLSIAFVPVFTEYLAMEGKEEAFKLAGSAIRILSLILIVITVLGIIFSPVIVHIIAPGFSDSPEKISLTATLTRIIFPYIFFICLVALCMGILNVLGHFSAPSIAPVLLNISMICSILIVSFFSADINNRIFALAIGVLIGGFLQLMLQVPFLIRKGFHFCVKVKFYHPGIKKIGILMLPAILGSAVYQINILIGTLLASLLPEGSVSYLYYADRLVQFPLGIFAMAAATAVLPSLSRQVASKDFAGVKDTFTYAINLVSFVTIPAMAGLIVLRQPIVVLLFKRGVFDTNATLQTSYALLFYSMGLWAFSSVRIVVSTFYALHDTKTPVKMAIISILANVILGIILMGPLKHGGLALSTSLASMLNLLLLIRALQIKLGFLEWKKIAVSSFKSSACSIIMGIAVWTISLYIFSPREQTISGLFFGITGSILTGLILYGFSSRLLKSRELEMVLSIVQKSVKRK
ncbi:MAG TPA: murein biosynthesis integral membrane protein MurJ [Desulfobacterales bacterium]|nr:murein biosynthesis integral membrane protein MurJ [Desulfobacterales bacterium]